jgi:hypothetical protein
MSRNAMAGCFSESFANSVRERNMTVDGSRTTIDAWMEQIDHTRVAGAANSHFGLTTQQPEHPAALVSLSNHDRSWQAVKSLHAMQELSELILGEAREKARALSVLESGVLGEASPEHRCGNHVCRSDRSVVWKQTIER